MFDNIFSKLKRRRLDENLSANRDGFGANVASNLNNIWDHLFGDNDASSTTTNTQNINNSRSGTAGDMSMAVDR